MGTRICLLAVPQQKAFVLNKKKIHFHDNVLIDLKMAKARDFLAGEFMK